MANIVISASMIAVALVLLSPKLRRSVVWQATTTPLASIIGSGFLVLGPLLSYAYGAYAPLVMAALCGVAYSFGSAIRFNMTNAKHANGKASLWLDKISAWALAFAYVVSIAYYLNLFGAFAVSLGGTSSAQHATHIALTAFGVILAIGILRGFAGLEFVEKLAVGLKLTIIGGLIAGLAVYFAEHAPQKHIIIEAASVPGWDGVFLAFGLLVTVQGFETSRYLTENYSTETAIRSMKIAQIVTAAIYLVYITLLTYSLRPSEQLLSETAIIDMMVVIAPILPGLLIAAALSAQLSAAIADTGGAGGLFSEASKGRITPKLGYVIVAAAGVAITVSSGVFEIISYASRAFAAYYALQAARAYLVSVDIGAPRSQRVLFAFLTALGVAIAIFGDAVETET